MTISLAELAELSRVALVVAEEGAAILTASYRTRPHAEEKGRADLVTELDRRSEAHVTARLRALTPEIRVIGEETAGSERPAGLVWYVDPLDGTTNFVHGHPFFAVAIGLMFDDEPVAGAVVAPLLRTRWRAFRTAADRGEAYRDDERCRVSPIADPAQAMIGTGFAATRDSPANNFGSFIEVKRAVQAVRRCGSAAIDLCFVADGTYEGFWERRLQTWDVCAASAIVLAAGGRVTALDGGPARYHQGHLCASNGKLHDALLELVSRGETRSI
jgi:myo-inositol-1(or 4)-monophosphatase